MFTGDIYAAKRLNPPKESKESKGSKGSAESEGEEWEDEDCEEEEKYEEPKKSEECEAFYCARNEEAALRSLSHVGVIDLLLRATKLTWL